MMKQDLILLYTQRQKDLKSIIEKFPNDDLAGPFLMSPNEEYNTQPNKLLIVGQQTKGWSSHIDNLVMQMQTYEKFNLGLKYYSSPFWNITRKLEKVLGNKPYSSAWTNLNKFDLKAGRPYGVYQTEISKLDDILLDEIEIIRPDFCIFFTGPYFDKRLKKIFTGIELVDIPGFTIRQFCKLKHPDLPENSFRSHHPKSLRIRQLENRIIDYLSIEKEKKAL